MFPLKDNIPLARFPLVTVALVAINVIAYLLEIRHGGSFFGGPADSVAVHYGAIPYELTHPGKHCELVSVQTLEGVGHSVACQPAPFRVGQPGVLGSPGAQPATWETVFTSMFLHGSFLHIFGNMLFLAIFAGLARVPGATYRQYLVPGIIVQNVALTAPTVGLGLVLDAASGITDRFRSLPIARSAVLLGRMLAESLIFLVQALLVLGVASLLGFRVRTGLPGMAGIVAVAVAFGLALGITMCWLALRINDPDTAGRALFLPMVPLTFISSTFTPIDRLARWLQPLARANPVTAAVNVIRTLAEGGPLGREPLYLAVWLLILSVPPGLLAVRRWQSG